MDKEIRVGIRADGGTKMGAGHLFRCMSIAHGFKKMGVSVLFYVADEDGASVLSREGMESKVLHTDYANLEAETDTLVRELEEDGICLLLVDSYFTTPHYLKRLNQVCPVFCLDDEGKEDRVMPVSGIINYNILGAQMPYANYWWVQKEKPLLLLGSEYAPVRPSFLETKHCPKPDRKKLMITMGGSDQFNIAGKLAKRLLLCDIQHLDIELICGGFNPYLKELQTLAENHANLSVAWDVRDMWNHMAQSDLVVAAASSTMYELCAIGVPTVCCFYVENQRAIAEGFEKRTKVSNCGNFAEEEETVLLNLVREISRLLEDEKERKAVADSMRKVCDGRGAERLARRLISYAEERYAETE